MIFRAKNFSVLTEIMHYSPWRLSQAGDWDTANWIAHLTQLYRTYQLEYECITQSSIENSHNRMNLLATKNLVRAIMVF